MAGERLKPKVAIFGGGVSGLTAAHELAVRGFQVEVIEKTKALSKEEVKGAEPGKRPEPTLGGTARTQYFVADPFSDPSSWEHRRSKLPLPASAPGWPGKAANPTGEIAGEDIQLAYQDPPGSLEDGASTVPLTAALARLIAPVLWECPLEATQEETRARRAWYYLRIEGSVRVLPVASQDECHRRLGWLHQRVDAIENALRRFAGDALPGSPSDEPVRGAGRPLAPFNEGQWEELVKTKVDELRAAEKLRLHTGTTPHPLEEALQVGALVSFARNTLKSTEWLHPATGIAVFRRCELIRTTDDSPVEPNAAASIRVSLHRLFPMDICFDPAPGTSVDAGVPQLSGDGEQQLELVGRALDRITAGYTQTPWVVVYVQTMVHDPGDGSMVKMADWGGRLVEERLRARARVVSTEPHRELVILRGSIGRQCTSGHFVVRVDVEPTLPAEIAYDPATQSPTADGAEKVEALAAAYRVMTSNHRWPRWFQLPFDQPEKSDVPLQLAIQEWLRRSREGLPLHPNQRRVPNGPRKELAIKPAALPGEHRPIVIAPYDRHLIDTLRRIPIAASGPKDRSADRARVVLDNLRPLFGRGVADWGGSGARLEGEAIDLRTPSAYFARLRNDAGGFAQLLLRLLRYATTCPARRAKELSHLSFWQYLEGCDHPLGVPRYRYSDTFRSDLSLLCRIVTGGLSADTGDAQTCMNIFLQVLTTSIRPMPEAYRAFNAPTTEAWINPWKEHLKDLGVTFTHGELTSLETERGDVAAYYTTFEFEAGGRRTAKSPQHCSADYYVVAIRAESARRLTWRLSGGVPDQLSAWLDAEPEVAPPDGRLKPVAGIQYFFVTDERAKIEPAFFCVRDHGWCMVAVTSDKLWDTPPRVPECGFTAMLSVDVLAWDTPAGCGPLAERKAWECTRAELAEEVWRRVAPHLKVRLPEGAPPLRPRWYHIDDNLRYAADTPERPVDGAPGAQQRRGQNRGPIAGFDALYAIPEKGDWGRRPGDLAPRGASGSRNADAAWLWQAEEGGYVVHGGKLVFAGAYMKTHTRLTSHEAANESARHAVNAIVRHHRMSPRVPRASGGDRPEAVIDEVWSATGGAWRRTAEAPRRERFDGDELCQVWNPEEDEIAELAKLKRYDAWCFERDLPHPWELLGVERLPSLMSWMPTAGAGARTQQGGVEQAPPWTSEAILRFVMSMRAALEERMPREPAAPAGKAK